jgi:O-antigen/teichoic acid export membrane protein
MTVVANPNLLRPIVLTREGDPVIQRVRGREGPQIFLVGAWLEDATNAGWSGWPYYNYLIYHLIGEASGGSPLSFADYPPAPVPHGQFRLMATIGGLALIVAAVSVFFAMRRLLFLNPATFMRERERLKVSDQLIDQGGWEQVGVQRPLAGLLALAGVGIWILIPLLFFNLYVRPQLLIPWPQTLTYWDWVGLILEGIWLLLDLGTGLAAVRYFAFFRVTNPREAFPYLQFYFWWQLISGAVQLGAVTWVAAAVLPNTASAHFSFFFFAHALVQFPGIWGVFRLFFRSMQRFDYEQILTLVPVVLTPLFQWGLVLLLRPWGAAQPSITEPVAAVIGLGLGVVLGEWAGFFAGAFLYRRMGYGFRWIFQPAFDQQVAGRVLWFGARLAVGDIAVPLGLLGQAFLIAPRVPDYSVISNAWALALTLTLAYKVLQDGLYADLMPALTQAYGHGYQTLARYYLGQGLRYGMWFGIFMLASLAAIGDWMILGIVGGGVTQAAELVGWLLFFGLMLNSLGAPDATLLAAGRPELRSLLVVIENGVRLGLLFLLAPRWGLNGMLAAYGGGLAARVAATWFVIGRLVLQPRISYWQTFAAPAGGAIVVFGLLRAVGSLLWQPSPTASVLLALFSSMPAFLLYALITGVLGGWDDGGLEELRKAVAISGPGWPVGELVYRAVAWGAGYSLLHGRFGSTLRPYAEEEAHALTFRRAPLE